MNDYKDENVWLMKGDCLERMKEIESGSVDMILADPPYGTTACKWDSVIKLDPMWNQLMRVIKSGCAIVMTASQPFSSILAVSNIDCFKYSWVWEKNRATNFPNAKRRPLTAHEDILVFISGKLFYNPQKTSGHKPTNSAKGCSHGSIYHGENVRDYEGGDTTRFPRTVLKFDCERGMHPTQKPVPLMEYMIKTYTNEGETVLDFTMGSGSTGVAARNLGRKFIGIEMDDHYFEVARGRILGDK